MSIVKVRTKIDVKVAPGNPVIRKGTLFEKELNELPPAIKLAVQMNNTRILEFLE